MQEHVSSRIDELIRTGNGIAHATSDAEFWMRDVVASQSWMTSAANVIQQVAPSGSFFRDELNRLTTIDDMKRGIPITVIKKVLGLLQSIQLEEKAGLLSRLEDQVVATAFDEFLDHAAEYHRSGKVREAAVLASAVLEDTIKRIGAKNDVKTDGVSLEPLIDELSKRNIFTQVKAKRLKSYSAIRNHALHAEWEKLDLRDVGSQISGVRELLDEHL